MLQLTSAVPCLLPAYCLQKDEVCASVKAMRGR